MVVDDESDILEYGLKKYRKERIENLKKLQNNNIYPILAEPLKVGKIKSRGFNNGNTVYQGPYGGFHYISRVSGIKTPIQKGQTIEFE